jgi:hypothetical protein
VAERRLFDATRDLPDRTQGKRQASDSPDRFCARSEFLAGVASRRGLSADEAFALPRRTSQDLTVELAELAHTLGTLTPSASGRPYCSSADSAGPGPEQGSVMSSGEVGAA